eukprot:5560437-Alexandrium_andersonii.AAC.1
MSASLVGSEMCIRDSNLTFRPTRPHLLGSVPLCVLSPMEATHWGGEAVSYTHLTLPTICSV